MKAYRVQRSRDRTQETVGPRQETPALQGGNGGTGAPKRL